MYKILRFLDFYIFRHKWTWLCNYVWDLWLESYTVLRNSYGEPIMLSVEKLLKEAAEDTYKEKGATE